jgi:hypothetical protein
VGEAEAAVGEAEAAVTDPRLAARIERTERELAADPRFEPEPEGLAPGETEIIIGEWIPGSRHPKEAEE